MCGGGWGRRVGPQKHNETRRSDLGARLVKRYISPGILPTFHVTRHPTIIIRNNQVEAHLQPTMHKPGFGGISVREVLGILIEHFRQVQKRFQFCIY